MTLFSKTNGYENTLNRTLLKQRVITQNIANVDTPNYKSKKVVFKDELNDSLQAYRSNQKHIPYSTNSGNDYYIKTEMSTRLNNNGNNVDMDQQMAELAKNQIYYRTMVEKLNGHLGKLKMVIRGGK